MATMGTDGKTVRMVTGRVFFDTDQEARLLRWERELKWLWNNALEQRFNALRRVGDSAHDAAWEPDAKARWKLFRSRVHWAQQNKELTDCRAASESLADVPSTLCQSLIRLLGVSWEQWFRKTRGRPRFKGRDSRVLLQVPYNGFRIVTPCEIQFAKLGRVRCAFGSMPSGEAKTLTLHRRGRHWYASVAVNVDVPTHKAAPGGSAIGLDRGVAVLVADSEGNTEPNPRYLAKAERKLKRLQRQLAKKQRGSKNREKQKLKIATVHAQVAQQRQWLQHDISAGYARSYETVVVEDLRIGNMTRSAKGTVEDPGVNVAAKSGLNRAILDAGWGGLVQKLEYKTAERGGRVVRVPAPHTSQTCSACGCVSKESRRSQSHFACVDCGHIENADTNAAKNILKRGLTQEKVHHVAP